MNEQDEGSNNPVFNELCLERKLCDVVISVDDVAFNVHKIILCGCSQYFRVLFTHGWSTPQQRLYDIPGVSANIMRLLIEFAYTGSVPVTGENVEELLAAADQLFFMGVVRACCQFLEEQLCPQNCIGIWKFVDVHYCPDLRRKAVLYILDHFEEVSEELLTLSPQQLSNMADILPRDNHLFVGGATTSMPHGLPNVAKYAAPCDAVLLPGGPIFSPGPLIHLGIDWHLQRVQAPVTVSIHPAEVSWSKTLNLYQLQCVAL
ncbi:kelch-like protein 10 [Centroberyx affinis]|uniref:kelch-like protein 10 n=1 Tax=Centroberyx affinis TaxID=166261 RepID=UPI003A5C4362